MTAESVICCKITTVHNSQIGVIFNNICRISLKLTLMCYSKFILIVLKFQLNWFKDKKVYNGGKLFYLGSDPNEIIHFELDIDARLSKIG